MWFTVSFFVELFILFLISRRLSRMLWFFFYKLTKNQTVTVHILAFLFLPGTVIHELAHALMASLLGVAVSDMEFIPKIRQDTVKLGSVAIAKTDPVRSILIGMAPFLFGTAILLGIVYTGTWLHLFSNRIVTVICVYAIFEIANTMFSSRKDMEGALELLIVCLILLIALFVLGIHMHGIDPTLFFSNPYIVNLMQKGSYYLLVPLGIDVITLLVLQILLRRY